MPPGSNKPPRSAKSPWFLGLDDVSSGSFSSSSKRSDLDDNAASTNPIVIRTFVMSVSGYRFVGRHARDHDGKEHRVDVGMDSPASNPNLACVRMLSDDPSMFCLEWVGWRSDCSVNMLVASLKLMLRMFEGCDRIDLMDTGKKEFEVPRVGAVEGPRTVKVPLGDLYSLTHLAAHGGRCVTWYMASLGAVPVSRETEEWLETNAVLLKRTVTMPSTSFCRACFADALSLRSTRWVSRVSEATAPLVDDAVRRQRSWGELFATIGKRVGGAAFAHILPRLPELLPGWHSVHGCAFTVPDARAKILGDATSGAEPLVEYHHENGGVSF